MKKDFYETLGISKNATDKEIKKAYHRLAKKYHPDTNNGNTDSEKKFKEISEAYEVLSNPEKKKIYDTYGMAAFDEASADSFKKQYSGQDFNKNYSYGFNNGNGYTEYHFNGNADDIFKDIFGSHFNGSFDDSFSGYFNNFSENASSSKRKRSFSNDDIKRDNTINAEINISLQDSAFGCDKNLKLQTTSGTSELRVHIPAGIAHGQTLRLNSSGSHFAKNGSGDILLKVNIMPDSLYERKSQDIYTTTQIPYYTAVLGGKVKMHTLYGTVECNIPAGTQSGSKIRLKNKGIVSLKNKNEYGDEYVTIQIQVPKSVSPEEKELIRKLSDINANKKASAYCA